MAVILVAVLSLPFGGCAAAFRLGAGAGLRSAALSTGARMAVARGAVGGATAAVGGRTVLGATAVRNGLLELTAGRRAPALLNISRNGTVLHRGKYVATLESNGTLVRAHGGSEYVLGQMTETRLWSVTESGALASPIARLRGFIPSRGVAVRTAPSTGATRVEILRGNVTAEVLQTQNGWFEIRLPNQTTGWVWGGLLALVLLADDSEDEDERVPAQADDVRVVLQNGSSLRADQLWTNGEIVHVTEASKHYTLDRAMVSHVIPLAELPPPDDMPFVQLVDGTAVAGVANLIGDGVAEIEVPGEERSVIVDASLIQDFVGYSVNRNIAPPASAFAE